MVGGEGGGEGGEGEGRECVCDEGEMVFMCDVRVVKGRGVMCVCMW